MTRRLLWVLSLLGWATCFGVLNVVGTWIPFAFLGIALVGLVLGTGVVSRELLRPSPRAVAQGVAAGVAMVLATHVAYPLVTRLAPPLRGATQELITMLAVPGFSLRERAFLITVIAGCEELIFRGLLPLAEGGGRSSRAELLRLGALTIAYALTTTPLGSPLLFVCALVCGGLWAVMRVASGSLIVPLFAHAIWDLGVLLLWPLS